MTFNALCVLCDIYDLLDKLDVIGDAEWKSLENAVIDG
jgi:hypothetical protein